MTRIVIMGGGPAGYEAALVAAQHGGDVTVVERDGMGGACVLDDCVPSKTLIASAGVRVELGRAPDLGFTVDRNATDVDLPRVNARVASLAMAQSADVRARVEREGVRIIRGSAAFADEPTARGLHAVEARTAEGGSEVLAADVVLVATGATPRVLDDAKPDGRTPSGHGLAVKVLQPLRRRSSIHSGSLFLAGMPGYVLIDAAAGVGADVGRACGQPYS